MSGAANKKKTRSQDWEEATGEFYQERYPSNEAELHDVLRGGPNHLATLLPSIQNRACKLIFYYVT